MRTRWLRYYAGYSWAGLSSVLLSVIHLRWCLPEPRRAAQPRPVYVLSGEIGSSFLNAATADALWHIVCECNANNDRAFISFAGGTQGVLWSCGRCSFLQSHVCKRLKWCSETSNLITAKRNHIKNIRTKEFFVLLTIIDTFSPFFKNSA